MSPLSLCEQPSAWKKRGPGVLDGVQRYGFIGCTGRSARKPTGLPAVPTGRAGAADRGRLFRPGEKGRAARRDARLTLWPPAGGTASGEMASDLAFSETRSSRHLSDDASRGVRGDSGAGGQGRLTVRPSEALSEVPGRAVDRFAAAGVSRTSELVDHHPVVGFFDRGGTQVVAVDRNGDELG